MKFSTFSRETYRLCQFNSAMIIRCCRKKLCMSRVHEPSRSKGNTSKTTQEMTSNFVHVLLFSKLQMISPLNMYLVTFLSGAVAVYKSLYIRLNYKTSFLCHISPNCCVFL